jgi:hypothetical protein
MTNVENIGVGCAELRILAIEGKISLNMVCFFP